MLKKRGHPVISNKKQFHMPALYNTGKKKNRKSKLLQTQVKITS